ncbi:MAG TPA: amidohydrolase family protein [Gaiellaceae bacterium]|nr:amidohydrolase family protein [Gaiellaceae bacterium]
MIVDAHQHFWDPELADYPWMTDELASLRRRYAPGDLEPLLRAHGVAGTIAVQARASLDETAALLATAEQAPFVVGVVGWIDLTAADAAGTLAGFGGRLVGIRHQVHDERDARWLLRDDVQRGLRAVGAAGLAYDLLVRTRELPAALETARRHPELRLVLDHVAKPPLASGELDAWAAGVEALSRLPNVTCKLSGLVTEASPSWQADELVSCLRRALDWFGAERCMFGSDWPVCLLAADYGQVLGLVTAALRGASEDERTAVLGGTALATYAVRSTNARSST